MFSSGSQLLCLQQNTATGRERGSSAPRCPRYRPSTGGFIRGQTGPSRLPAPRAGPPGIPGWAAEKGPGEAERGGGSHAAAGRAEPRRAEAAPRIPGELRFQRAGGGSGAGACSPRGYPRSCVWRYPWS